MLNNSKIDNKLAYFRGVKMLTQIIKRRIGFLLIFLIGLIPIAYQYSEFNTIINTSEQFSSTKEERCNIRSSGILLEKKEEFQMGEIENLTITANNDLILKRNSTFQPYWEELNTTNGPTGRTRVAMSYDTHTNKIIIYGGDTGTRNEETWVFDYTTMNWTNPNPFPKPSARSRHTMVYDSFNGKTILFGGTGTGGDETWAYDSLTNTWENMNPPTHPDGRYDHSMAFDSKMNKVVLFGGIVGGNYDDETWTYDYSLNIWTEMTSTLKPAARELHSMAYDPVAEKTFLFGGDNGGSLNDLWAYDFSLNTWTDMSPSTKPSARHHHAMAYNSELQKIVLFGGYTSSFENSETWMYDSKINNWEYLSLTPKPFERSGHEMVYNPVENKIIIFGGLDLGSMTYFADTWALSLSSFYKTGILRSRLIDLDFTYQITGQVYWSEKFFASTANLTLQIGFSNSSEEEDFHFTSPADSSFTFSGNARYLRYFIWYQASSDKIASPSLDFVYIDYTLEDPIENKIFEMLVSYIAGNVTKLEDLYILLGENISLVEEHFTHLGFSIGDTDYDGLSDLSELKYGTNITCSDTDCDNLNDAFEIKYGTDPLNDDSDGDSWYDGVEVAAGTNPKDASDYPGKDDPTDDDASDNDTTDNDTAPDITISGYPFMFLLINFFIIGLYIKKRTVKRK